MSTKYLCVLIHTRIKGEVGTMRHVKPSGNFLTDHSKATLPLWIFFVICVLCLSLPYCIICFWSVLVTCLERADLLALLYVMYSCVFVHYPYGVLGQVWYLIVSISDLCLLP